MRGDLVGEPAHAQVVDELMSIAAQLSARPR
jgi:hypothetical protein